MLIAVLAWIPALVGLGSLLRYGGDPALRRAISGVLGLGVLATAAGALHLAVPVGPAATAALWLAGMAVLAVRRRWLLEGARWYEAASAAAAVILLASWTPPPRDLYDTGLYYLQTIRWTTDHPLRAGLALLHHRLALDSAWLVASAALELPGLEGRSPFFANLLPAAFAAAGAAVGLRRLADGAATFGDAALALGLLVVWHRTSFTAAPSPDTAASLLVYLALALWGRALEAEGHGFRAEARAAVLVSVLAVLVKASAAPVLTAAVAALVWRRRDVRSAWLARSVGIAAVPAALWAVRSVLLSGCVLFPAAWSSVPGLPWGMPEADVRALAELIRSWARAPGVTDGEAGGWAWIPGWATRVASRPDVRPLLFTACLGGALLSPAARRVDAALLIPLAAAGSGLVFVFVSAPEPRFAYGFLHAAGLLPAAFGLARMPRLRSNAAGALVALVLAGAAALEGHGQHAATGWDVPRLRFPRFPAVATRERATSSGLLVRVPLVGDQCWAAPEPCTPHLRPDLAEARGRFTLVPPPTSATAVGHRPAATAEGR